MTSIFKEFKKKGRQNNKELKGILAVGKSPSNITHKTRLHFSNKHLTNFFNLLLIIFLTVSSTEKTFSRTTYVTFVLGTWRNGYVHPYHGPLCSVLLQCFQTGSCYKKKFNQITGQNNLSSLRSDIMQSQLHGISK